MKIHLKIHPPESRSSQYWYAMVSLYDPLSQRLVRVHNDSIYCFEKIGGRDIELNRALNKRELEELIKSYIQGSTIIDVHPRVFNRIFQLKHGEDLYYKLAHICKSNAEKARLRSFRIAEKIKLKGNAWKDYRSSYEWRPKKSD